MGCKSSSSARSDYQTASAFPSSANLGRVWVSKRRIYCVYGSPNHWAVIIEVFGHGFVCVQFYDRIGITYHQTMRDAALANWGCYRCDVRTSKYDRARAGFTVGDLRDYVARLERGGYAKYSLFFKNCQDFSRTVVGWLTRIYVAAFPTEDGPDFLV